MSLLQPLSALAVGDLPNLSYQLFKYLANVSWNIKSLIALVAI